MSKIIFLTGGTGSFGQAFTKYALNDPDVAMIRIYSRDEHKQREMRKRFPQDRVSFFVGDVRDKDRLLDAMESSHWVIHAAALKQAPLGEIEPQEFIKTNILGSMNVIQASFALDVEKALLISTDKAVEPINLYGATKMCSERLFIQADACRGGRQTRFACTRYGNVAGTAGSIIPILKGLNANEHPVVYDPNATRFWITLEQACEFVMSRLKTMKGGELFIPKLKSVRVTDIVRAICPERAFVVSRPRQGDKTHEILESREDGSRYSSDNNEFLTVEEIRHYVDCCDRMGAQ